MMGALSEVKQEMNACGQWLSECTPEYAVDHAAVSMAELPTSTRRGIVTESDFDLAPSPALSPQGTPARNVHVAFGEPQIAPQLIAQPRQTRHKALRVRSSSAPNLESEESSQCRPSLLYTHRVSISDASIEECNGSYACVGSQNNFYIFENSEGSVIYFDDGKWKALRKGDTGDCEFSSDSCDSLPPAGTWTGRVGSCTVAIARDIATFLKSPKHSDWQGGQTCLCPVASTQCSLDTIAKERANQMLIEVAKQSWASRQDHRLRDRFALLDGSPQSVCTSEESPTVVGRSRFHSCVCDGLFSPNQKGTRMKVITIADKFDSKYYETVQFLSASLTCRAPRRSRTLDCGELQKW